METKTNLAQPTEFIIPKETSWHFERKLKPDDKKVGNYVLIQPGAPDVVKVLKAYAHHPIPAYNIVSIEILYNEMLNRQFYGHIKLMNDRKGNPKFIPSWRKTVTGTEKVWREATYQRLKDLSEGYGDPDVPNILLLPLWHGTSDQVSNYIFSGGYGIFSSNDPDVVTDEGFFGKGVYTAHEAEYAFRSYASKHGDKAVLLLNWVSTFEAYPVIDGDMPKLKGKMGGYDQCDAHFIPVRSDLHPNTDTYYPCVPSQDADYHEMVVFTYQQCLPRYRMKLIQNAPQPPLDDAAILYYQSGLDSFSLGQYGQVANAWEDAATADHPGAPVRLHWWYSGSSGVYPANPQALSKVQSVQSASVNTLKQKANFKGDNDQESQFTLAWCYQHGLGCGINLVKAAQYYWIAAVQGHRDAQYQLGVCCASGIGVKPDMKQAIVYYEQAAAQGHVHAHYVLSQCYESGLGTKANLTKAQEHKQAAQKGKHPQLVGTGLPQTTSVSIAPNVQLEQKVKQLEQQLAQQTTMLKEKELQLAQQISTSNQKELEFTQEKLKLKQQQDKAVQDQQKIKELAQAVSAEQQSKDQLIAKQKEEQRKKDDIIVKQTQEKAAQEIQLRDKDQWLEQQTQKITDLVKELQLTQQKLGQKDEMLNNQWFELEQLKKDLAESKERENQLKREFEASKTQSQSPMPKPQSQVNPLAVNPFGGNYSPMLFQPESQKVLSVPEQVEQVSTVAKEQNKIRQEEVQALLKWVTEGHLVEVETLLKKNPSLGVCTGTVKDWSDRTFKNITALQYAAWCLDKEMCDLIMDYLGTHNSAIQLKAFYAEPKRYSDYGTHYTIKPLIEKTQHYVKNLDKWWKESQNQEKCYRYWQKEVGGEQRKCPAWLIYAWSEEGYDVAWTQQDFSRKVKREYDKKRLDWWFTSNYYKGRGVGSTWSGARGSDSIFAYQGPFLGWIALEDLHNKIILDAGCQAQLDKVGVEHLAKLKSLSEVEYTTQVIPTPVKK